jgi:hypothetical protein
MKLKDEPTGTDSRLCLRNCKERFRRDVSIAAVIDPRAGITESLNARGVPQCRKRFRCNRAPKMGDSRHILGGLCLLLTVIFVAPCRSCRDTLFARENRISKHCKRVGAKNERLDNSSAL